MVRILLLSVLTMFGGACEPVSEKKLLEDIPRGYYAQLAITHNGQHLHFGPFVGYHFKPKHADDLSRLQFLCFNARQFYTDELPDNALLFEGEAVFTTLSNDIPIPEPDQRINPVFFKRAPEVWKASRPFPEQEFVHFHSGYNQNGAVHSGYWLRHSPVANFTYNMGGRVTEGSPLFHEAVRGESNSFPAIIEFDFGPGFGD